MKRRNLAVAQMIAIAEQMMTIEDRIQMEEEAKEAKGKTGRDEATGKFSPLPPIPEVAVTSSKEVARKLAEKAGVGERSVYHVHAVLFYLCR